MFWHYTKPIKFKWILKNKLIIVLVVGLNKYIFRRNRKRKLIKIRVGKKKLLVFNFKQKFNLNNWINEWYLNDCACLNEKLGIRKSKWVNFIGWHFRQLRSWYS